MHCIDDTTNGIILNHDLDWTGEARIAWYLPSERREPGPTPPSLRECWCSAHDLVAGRFTPTPKLFAAGEKLFSGSIDPSSSEPPVNVLMRAVALAVEKYLRFEMGRAVAALCIDRGDEP